ncbi:hypothetical protein [Gemmobacter denitrificans]|uniref:Uncharacterized protein n=1 Tax=Gemmobacter denitrificans TaxID=3123040 RepID=A0ABU8BQY3_9RHOB
MQMFIEVKGGQIISTATGNTVATVEVLSLTTQEAAQVMAIMLDALESAFKQQDHATSTRKA